MIQCLMNKVATKDDEMELRKRFPVPQSLSTRNPDLVILFVQERDSCDQENSTLAGT